MKEPRYIYYWYNQGLPLTMQEDIDKIIVSHDWESFCKVQSAMKDLQSVLEQKENFPLFPTHIVDCENDSHIPLNEQNFKLIEYSECEHG